MNIFFSAGEPSGDQHTAHLIEEFRYRVPELVACGLGGPRMKNVGCDLHFQLTDLAVMGIVDVLPLLKKFKQLVREAGEFFRSERPDAVVLINFSGFNFQIAREAKAAGVPVFFFLPPQLWAWGSWRIKRMRQHVDHVLCNLKFEHEWYTERGVSAELVGHPFFDEVARHQLDTEFRDQVQADKKRIIGVLPGSRSREIKANWPVMLRVMEKVKERHPDVKFVVAGYKEEFVARCREMMDDEGFDLPIEFHTGKTPEVIESAECCLMVSGSVSLEMLARATPAVVIYRAGIVEQILGHILIKLKYWSLPNLMANKLVIPEHITMRVSKRFVRKISGILNEWMADPHTLGKVRHDLEELRAAHVQPGAIANTASAILEKLPELQTVKRAA